MPTIEEMNSKMTIFYYKSNGDIYSIATGIQDFGVFFGEHAVDMAQIIDSIIVERNEFVLNNSNLYKVDEAGKLKLTGEIPV